MEKTNPMYLKEPGKTDFEVLVYRYQMALQSIVEVGNLSGDSLTRLQITYKIARKALDNGN